MGGRQLATGPQMLAETQEVVFKYFIEYINKYYHINVVFIFFDSDESTNLASQLLFVWNSMGILKKNCCFARLCRQQLLLKSLHVA